MTLPVPVKSPLLSMIESDGEDGFLDRVCCEIAEGKTPMEVAESLGVNWWGMRGWLELSQKRMDALAMAKRCFADKLAWESLKVAREATIEGVSVAKLQSDKMGWMAGKLDRVGWGEEKAANTGFGAGGITITVNRISAPKDDGDAVIVEG